jgi:5-methyltetrahydropteroyltriglutamate--homocysteine methyltransferase
MKRSTERILTTHVGSLARPDALVPVLKAKDRVQPYDRDACSRLVREAVATSSADRPRPVSTSSPTASRAKRASSATSWSASLDSSASRLRRQEGSTRAGSREFLDFPDYYAWSDRIAEWAGDAATLASSASTSCTGR